MIPPRWTFGHGVALVELVCGVAGAAWLVVGWIEAEAAGSAGRSLFDRAIPLLLAAAVGVGLAAAAVRSWRAANRAARQPAAPAAAASVSPPPAQLSLDGERAVAEVVAALAEAGVFAPRVPDPDQLREAVADHGQPVTAAVVLAAMAEAGWHRPGFRASEHSANLAFHDSHVEQLPEVLLAQVEDIARLGGDGPAVSADVEIGDPQDARQVPTRIRLRVGGTERVLDYAGAWKYLSTVLHVALAEALRERGTPRRLAWLWSDQGVWLSGLRPRPGEVERLNAALGQAAAEGWAWVDEQAPTAAGDPVPGTAR
jgi:hypothetical protein